MAREQMQHEARQNATFRDQHGRAYHAIVDTRSKPIVAPCTPLIPDGWSAPVMPPMPRAHPTELGKLYIDYDRWLDDQVSSEAAYSVRLQQISERMFGDDAVDAIKRRDPRLIAELGPPPQSSLFIRAAKAGNKWALGLVPITEVPSWAAPLLDTLPQFRKHVEAADTASLEFPDLVDEVAAGREAATLDPGSDEALDALFGTTPAGAL